MATKLIEKLLLLFIFLTILNCGSSPDFTGDNTIVILENVFEHEFTFGDDDALGDYLLANPRGIIVANNGDIIIADENRLKVFDKEGSPKKLIGGRGEGPGEFGPYPIPTVTYNGYITVREALSNVVDYNFYTPDYTFIEKKFAWRTQERRILREKFNLILRLPENLFVYSSTEKIIHTDTQSIEERTPMWSIIHIIEDSLSLIAHYENKEIIGSGPRAGQLPEYGELHMALLPDKRIVFANTGEHKVFENETWFYSLYIHDLKTNERIEIRKEYVPVAIPDSVINGDVVRYRGPGNRQQQLKMQRDRLKEIGVYGTFKELLTDNEYMFVVSFETDNERGNVVDVFDSSTGVQVSTCYFPFIPDVIKNGYAYRLLTGDNIFAVVEKYKVKPAVYGR